MESLVRGYSVFKTVTEFTMPFEHPLFLSLHSPLTLLTDNPSSAWSSLPTPSSSALLFLLSLTTSPRPSLGLDTLTCLPSHLHMSRTTPSHFSPGSHLRLPTARAPIGLTPRPPSQPLSRSRVDDDFRHPSLPPVVGLASSSSTGASKSSSTPSHRPIPPGDCSTSCTLCRDSSCAVRQRRPAAALALQLVCSFTACQ